MTKSTITRERAQQIFLGNGPEPSASEERELARMALAAMDSEPVAWMHNNNNIGIPAITTSQKIGKYWMSEFKDVQPLYRHAHPAPVVPNGLRLALSNAGIAAPESDEMLAATCEKHIQALVTWVRDRKPFQSAPVVMDDRKLRSLFDSWFASDCSFDLSPEASEEDNIAWRESYWYVWQRCRAAMLQAQSDADGEPTDDERIMAIEGIIKPISDCDTPVYPDVEKRIADAVELLKKAAPAMLAGKSGPDGPLAGRMKSPAIQDGYVMVAASLLSELRDWAHPEIEEYCEMWAGRRDDEFPALRKVIADADALLAVAPQSPGSEPATVPGKWIPVSERMPEVGDIVLTAMGGVVNVGEMECSAANCRFFTSVISGRELPATHWMPLPAGPQEVKGE